MLRILVAVLLVGQLVATAIVWRPDLLHLGAGDSFTYYAAGLRLDAGHHLYGPLLPGDLPVPRYPERYPAPILSPPLVAIIWRPLALLPGMLAMSAWWLVALIVMILVVFGLVVVGDRRSLLVLIGVQLLGIPLTIVANIPYQPGIYDPISIAALSGNINVYLVALFVLVWWAACRGRAGLAGAAAGLAAILKLSPIMLLWWFVTRGTWPTARAFVVTCAGLAVAGLIFAGLSNNLDFARVALGGGVRPTSLSLASIIDSLGTLTRHPNLARRIAGYSTILVTGLGFVLMVVLRRRPRAGFGVAILTVIFSSPVVLEGNFTLLLALAAPWAMPADPTGAPTNSLRERLGAIVPPRWRAISPAR